MASYSRISKLKQQQMMQQSVFFILLAVVVVLFFFFVILPQSIRLYDSLSKKTGSPNLNGNDTIPPQTPILYPLPEATSSASLSIQGYGEPDSTIELFRNGTEISTITARANGEFTFSSVFLSEGENQLYVVSIDAVGNKSTSLMQTVIIDSQPPEFSIAEPNDNITITRRKDQVISVKGTTEPQTKMYVNGKLLPADLEGNFSGSFSLTEGDNTLIFKAVDAAGNSLEQQRAVSFHP